MDGLVASGAGSCDDEPPVATENDNLDDQSYLRAPKAKLPKFKPEHKAVSTARLLSPLLVR